jgi:hypothetical protein
LANSAQWSRNEKNGYKFIFFRSKALILKPNSGIG